MKNFIFLGLVTVVAGLLSIGAVLLLFWFLDDVLEVSKATDITVALGLIIIPAWWGISSGINKRHEEVLKAIRER